MRQPARLSHVARASCPLGQGRPARAPSWPGRPCHWERSAGPALRPCGTSGLRRAWARRTGKFRWAKAEPSLEKPAGKAARLESEPCATFCPVACATGPATHTSTEQLSAELKVKTRGAGRCSAVRRRRLASDVPTGAAVARSAGIVPAGAGGVPPVPRHGRDGHATGNVAQGPLSGPAALLACGGPGRDARGNSDGRKPNPRRKIPLEKPQGWRASLALRFAGWPAPPDPRPTLPRISYRQN